MASFKHDGFEIAYAEHGGDDNASAETVLLIHGFASSFYVNWVGSSWIKALTEGGYQTLALDNRGHGRSSKSYNPEDYTPEKMASDAAALIRHLGLPRVHVMGYSMGARIAAFLALAEPAMVATLVFGGLGIGLVDGVGDWDPIAEALLAPDPAAIENRRGKAFRAFADQTRSDRQALAACISTSRALLSEADMARIAQPTLVAVGTNDDIAGSATELAGLMPHAEAFDIDGRDHMLAVGDRRFKERVIEFLRAHPL